MPRWLSAAALLLSASACLDTRPYGPAGYACQDDVDCPSGTTCFRLQCEVKSETPDQPTAANTGVPPSVSLRLSGPLTLVDAGVVLEGLDVQGCVSVRASNITLRRSRITCSDYFAFEVADGAHDVVLEDVEIDGRGNDQGHGIAGANVTARRVDLHGLNIGAELSSNSELSASYVHDLVGSKPFAVQVNGGQQINVSGDVLDLGDNRAGWAFFGSGALARLSEVTVSQSWLSGGGNTVEAGAGTLGSDNVVVKQNRFGREFGAAPLVLYAGAVEYQNVWGDDGGVIP